MKPSQYGIACFSKCLGELDLPLPYPLTSSHSSHFRAVKLSYLRFSRDNGLLPLFALPRGYYMHSTLLDHDSASLPFTATALNEQVRILRDGKQPGDISRSIAPLHSHRIPDILVHRCDKRHVLPWQHGAVLICLFVLGHSGKAKRKYDGMFVKAER